MRSSCNLVVLGLVLPSVSFALDSDLDGLDDPTELLLGTDPWLADTDGDRFSDGGEVLVISTNPLLVDPICEWPAHPITGDGGDAGVWAEDLDNDGDVDVIDLDQPGPSAWENRGPLGFVKHRVADLPTVCTGVHTADLDGDGLKDILVATSNWLWTIRNHGGFAFGAAVQVGLLERVDTIAAEDMDLDGDRDVVAWANSNNGYDLNEGVLLDNLGAGQLAPPRRFDADWYNVGIAVGHLDTDGWPDVLAWGADTWWYQNRGPYLPLQPRILITERSPERVDLTTLAIADLDGDGWGDVMYADTSRQLFTVLWNGAGNGGGAFGPSAVLDPRTVVDAPQVMTTWPADVDGDGDLDALVQQIGDVDALGWVPNLGGRAFGPVEALQHGSYNGGIIGADMDGDGDPDIVIPGAVDDTSWIENIGVGDPDGDGLDSRDEVCFTRSDPQVADTDGGGVPDGAELQVGRNPLDPGDDLP